jgi:1-acyl-sn-glycerol-3-phosphate acyltransferase
MIAWKLEAGAAIPARGIISRISSGTLGQNLAKTMPSLEQISALDCGQRRFPVPEKVAAARPVIFERIVKAFVYQLVHSVARLIRLLTIRLHLHGIENGERQGGYILACAHVSHLDPFCIGSVWPRKIGWMARIEFYRRAWAAHCLSLLHAFPVNRQGVPVSTIKEGLARLSRGEIVGMFPEGEIKRGSESVLRGGTIKRGVCLLSLRSGRPVLPCIVVGTDKLNTFGSWIPGRKRKLWIFCGDFVLPKEGLDRRMAREEMAREIEIAFIDLYRELRKHWGLNDSMVP